MAESSYPFDNADTTETQYSQLFRRLRVTGVWGAPDDTALKAFGDSSGMQVKLPAGFAIVRGHAYVNDATKTVAVGASGAVARIDTLVLRLDPSANTIVPVVVAGTPGSGVGPTLTQTDAAIYELPLSNIAVGVSAATITAGVVTDQRIFTGIDYVSWTTSTRPTSPRTGQPGFNVSTGKPEYYDGSAWKEFVTASTFGLDLVNSADAAAARTKIGGTTIGKTIFTSADVDAVLTALGVTALGKSLMTATNVTAARQALRIFETTAPGSPATGDFLVRDL